MAQHNVGATVSAALFALRYADERLRDLAEQIARRGVKPPILDALRVDLSVAVHCSGYQDKRLVVAYKAAERACAEGSTERALDEIAFARGAIADAVWRLRGGDNDGAT